MELLQLEQEKFDLAMKANESKEKEESKNGLEIIPEDKELVSNLPPFKTDGSGLRHRTKLVDTISEDCSI
jgi:hypothetical protein